MANNLGKRLGKLEDIVQEHLRQSGFIQTNLKWNTIITSGIAVTVVGRLLIEFLFHK